ncbi:hypothetical protein [Mesorhizobium sp. BR-1-1-10]|uniref:hypothetical protein n=1 Tax=Mesorhizobium sp. BR-1-1-10 TaxID=2876660 RepID=UPI001CD08C5B|nr:hypothetical protein [Mesorhizobium sp. BR-1-1-10]MBZ9974209.1 hypothetical protein [Mesorhizobium sp. BR-1-1-10]
MRLAEIDEIFERAPGCRLVDELRTDESGVDPVGLRQLNLDLMDDSLPGINNVTQHVRPYTFMAWAAWKASIVAREAENDDPEVVADLVDRYEALYAWSHQIAGRPFRGAAALKRTIGHRADREPFVFSGPVWKQYRDSRTSFMAPTEYGPSIKSIRYIGADSGYVAEEAMPAVRDFEARVRDLLPARLFAIDAPSVMDEEIAPFAQHLPVDAPSEIEMKVFRGLFFDIGGHVASPGSAKRRKGTIDLVRGLLLRDGPSSIDSIRRQFARHVLPAVNDGDPEQIAISGMLLCLLQARQLQRLATEAMLFWLERLLSEGRIGSMYQPKTSEELIARAHNAAAAGDATYASSATIGDFLLSVEIEGQSTGWPGASSTGTTDAISMIAALIEAQRRDVTRVPALAARSFAIVRAVANAFEGKSPPGGLGDGIEGRPDRLPMGLMARRLEAVAARPMPSIWQEVIESWVIGQHVHWSAVRGGDGKKRLRIGLEGNGWMRVRRSSSRSVYEPTGDRLQIMLSLAVSCGLFSRDADGRYMAD